MPSRRPLLPVSRRAVVAVGALALVAACKGKDGGGHATAGPPPGGSAAAPAPAPASPPADFVALATAGKQPALVGPFAAVRLTPDLTIRDARKAAPALFVRAADSRWFEATDDRFPGLRFQVERLGQIDDDPEDWSVGTLQVLLPEAGLRERLTAAWGPPRGAGAPCWFDPDAGLRACLRAGKDGARLTFDGYVPLARLLGDGRERFGFEGDRPLIGATQAEIHRRFPHRVHEDGDQLWLWPVELGTDRTVVHLGDVLDTPEPIRGFSIELPSGQVDEATALLAQKLGKPVETDDGLVFAKRPRVVLVGDVIDVGAAPDL